MSEFAVFNPHPVRHTTPDDVTDTFDTARMESPLHHAVTTDSAAIPQAKGDTAEVILGERALLGHLVLRGRADDPAFSDGIEAVLGVVLPIEPMSSAMGESARLHWRSPDEWLAIVPGGEEYRLEMALRDATRGHVSVVNVSGGQTVVTLSGPRAREVLMKSTPVDVHPRAFPVGRSVTSCFAKGQAMICRVGESQWELVIRRSYADYFWQWLLDAGREYGVLIAP